MISDTCFPTPGSTPTFFDTYQFLSRIVYLFSNNLLRESEEHIVHLLDTLVDRIPRALIFTIFRSNSPSVRALWEHLLERAIRYNVIRGLTLLITIAIRLHSEWIDDEKDTILFAAVLTDDKSLVRQLLTKGARPTYTQGAIFETLFFAAAIYETTDCAKLVIDNYDPNEITNVPQSFPWGYIRRPSGYGRHGWVGLAPPSIFSLFLSQLGLRLNEADAQHVVEPAVSMLGYFDVLDLMLEANANVDSIFPFATGYCNSLYSQMAIPSRLMPTCLDICYQWHPTLADHLLPYSNSAKVELTRVGVATAAQQGKVAFMAYLNSVAKLSTIDTHQFLQLILAEQFCALDSGNIELNENTLTDPTGRIPRTLIECGVHVTALDTDQNGPLRAVVLTAKQQGLNENLLFLIAHIIEQGAPVDSFLLSWAVEETGIEVLDALLRLEPQAVEHGHRALVEAARKLNYEAVSLLLTQSVHIDGEVSNEIAEKLRDDHEIPCTPLAQLMAFGVTRLPEEGSEIIGMLQFLLDNGAKLRLNLHDLTCYELLKDLARSDDDECNKNFDRACSLLDFALQFEEETSQLSPSQWLDILMELLETAALDLKWKRFRGCWNLPPFDSGIIDTLFQRCEYPLPQPILAKAILANCELGLIKGLIASGARINAYSGDFTPIQAAARVCNYELVLLLLRLGADVNAPAKGKKGGTTLQFICGLDPQPAEIMGHQYRLIRLLVNKGADMNAPVHGAHGATPLQLICRSPVFLDAHVFEKEDMASVREREDYLHELIKFLIEKGADVNAEPAVLGRTALQGCAESGRLKDATLLVQHGADLNAFPSPLDPWTISSNPQYASALDSAAFFGRLDMTQYLLNLGALSATPGATGFQGAVDYATGQGHHAIAETIRRHVLKVVGRPDFNIDVLVAQHAASLEKRKSEYEKYVREEYDDESE